MSNNKRIINYGRSSDQKKTYLGDLHRQGKRTWYEREYQGKTLVDEVIVHPSFSAALRYVRREQPELIQQTSRHFQS